METAPAQPAQVPAPAPAPAAPVSTEYTSNPFSLVIKSLGHLLELNGAQGLLLALRLVLVCIGALLIAGLFAVLHIGVVAFLVIVLLYLYAIFAFTAATAVIGANTANDQAGESKAMFSLVNSKVLPMAGLIILTGLAIMLGLVLVIIPGLIFAAWFSLAPYVMISENLGTIDSMKRSKQLVSGHVFEMWGMIFASGILSGNGLLSFLVVPAGMVGRYRQLKVLKDTNGAKPAVHWSNYVLPIVGFAGIIIYVILLAVAGAQQAHNQSTNLGTSSTYMYTNTPSQSQ